MSESPAAAASYRLGDAGPRPEVVLPEKVMKQLALLRDIASEVARRAKKASAAGDFGTAARNLGAVKQLGAANRGPEVSVLVDMTGRSIEEFADRELSELNAPRTETSSAPASLHIDKVLDLWSSGDQDGAIKLLLEMNDAQVPAACYRPCNLSEQQVIARPLAEIEALKVKVLAKLGLLREIAREVARRAKEDLAAGEFDTATRNLEALKRLGAANRGPEVNLAVDMVGRMIEELADAWLSELNEQRTKVPAGP